MLAPVPSFLLSQPPALAPPALWSHINGSSPLCVTLPHLPSWEWMLRRPSQDSSPHATNRSQDNCQILPRPGPLLSQTCCPAAQLPAIFALNIITKDQRFFGNPAPRWETRVIYHVTRVSLKYHRDCLQAHCLQIYWFQLVANVSWRALVKLYLMTQHRNGAPGMQPISEACHYSHYCPAIMRLFALTLKALSLDITHCYCWQIALSH